MIRLTITLPLQPPTTPFFRWKILLLELASYTITYICALHTCVFNHQPQPPIHAPVTDRTHLLTCTKHTYQVACSAGSLPTNQSMCQNGGLRCVDEVANELWARIFSHGFKLFGLGACSPNNTELGSMVPLAIFFQSMEMDYQIKPWATKINMDYI